MPLSSSSLRTKKQAVWFVIIGVGILMAFCTWRLALWKEEAIRGMENKRHQDELQAIQSELQRKASELSSQLSAKQDEIDSQKRATGELKDQLGKLGSQLSDLKTERQKSDNPSSPPKAVVQMKKEESTVRNTIVTENAKTDFTNAAVPPHPLLVNGRLFGSVMQLPMTLPLLGKTPMALGIMISVLEKH